MIAVVILNWNGRGHLERFLPSVVAHSAGARIVVADNGSTDDSLGFMRENYPGIRIISLDKNYGFAEGYNRALAQVEAKYYMILNSDVEVSEGWLAPMIELMESDGAIKAVMPKIRSLLQPEKFEYAGACGGFIDMLGYPFCRGRVMDRTETDNGQYDDRCEIFWATGACMLIDSAEFHRCGGFDGDFFAHQEEIDLCWRIQSAGGKVYVEPRSMVGHLGGGTLAQDNPYKTYLNFRNNLFMLYKNLSPRSLWPVIAARHLLDGLSGLVFLAQGKKEMYRSVVRAHKDYRAARPALRVKRAAVQAERVVSPTTIYKGSIVLNYYLKWKTFSDK